MPRQNVSLHYNQRLIENSGFSFAKFCGVPAFIVYVDVFTTYFPFSLSHHCSFLQLYIATGLSTGKIIGFGAGAVVAVIVIVVIVYFFKKKNNGSAGKSSHSTNQEIH